MKYSMTFLCVFMAYSYTFSQSVVNFIDIFVSDLSQKNISGLSSLYADNVDYYGAGRVNKSFIVKDKASLFKRWDAVKYVRSSDVKITNNGDAREVEFSYSYSVSNSKKTLAGEAVNFLTLQRSGSSFVIVKERQKNLGSSNKTAANSGNGGSIQSSSESDIPGNYRGYFTAYFFELIKRSFGDTLERLCGCWAFPAPCQSHPGEFDDPKTFKQEQSSDFSAKMVRKYNETKQVVLSKYGGKTLVVRNLHLEMGQWGHEGATGFGISEWYNHYGESMNPVYQAGKISLVNVPMNTAKFIRENSGTLSVNFEFELTDLFIEISATNQCLYSMEEFLSAWVPIGFGGRKCDFGIYCVFLPKRFTVFDNKQNRVMDIDITATRNQPGKYGHTKFSYTYDAVYHM